MLATGAALLLFTLGFVLFATVVTRPPAVADPRADGIVVLTGESRRIAEGARLLKEGRAERMLISGVFRHTGSPIGAIDKTVCPLTFSIATAAYATHFGTA